MQPNIVGGGLFTGLGNIMFLFYKVCIKIFEPSCLPRARLKGFEHGV